jgi:hypothetical protein
LEDAVSLGRRECLVEIAPRVSREVVEHDADSVGIGVVHVHEVSHALGKIEGSAPVGNLDVPPRPMRIEEDKQVGGAVASILIVVPLASACPRRYR